MGLKVFTKLLGMVQIFILARLLDPKDFGVFGIAMLVLGALQTFSETGFNAALIQKNEDIESYLDTAWLVQVTRGFLLCILMILSVPLVSWFFREPMVAPLLYVMAANPFILGFRNIGIIYFQKELEFSKQFVFQSIVSVGTVIVGVTFAFIFRNAWALVIMSLTGAALQVTVSYILHPFRPTPRFHLTKAKVLFHFGKWVLSTKIMKFFVLQGDSMFIGRLLGTTPLGFYQMAMKVSQMPATEIGDIIGKVTFPAFSKMQGNLPALRSAWLKTVQFVTLITIPLAGGIFVLAPEIVFILLGPKWEPIVPVLRVLSVLGALKTVGNFGPIFRAVGLPKIITLVTLWRLVLMLALIYPLTTRFGPVGAGLSVLIASLGPFPWALSKALRILDCRLSEFLHAIGAPCLGMFLMVLGLFILKIFIGSVNVFSFIGLIVFGGLLYGGCLLIIEIVVGEKRIRNLVSILASGVKGV